MEGSIVRVEVTVECLGCAIEQRVTISELDWTLLENQLELLGWEVSDHNCWCGTCSTSVLYC